MSRSLASQPQLIGEIPANERPYLKKQVGQLLRKNIQGCLLASNHMHANTQREEAQIVYWKQNPRIK